MIQVEFMSWPSLAAILAGALIPRIDVISTEANLTLGYPIISNQENDARHTNDPVNHTDGFVMDRDREVAPAFKIEGLVLLIYRFGNSLIKKGEGAAHRSHMDRQIGTIKNQYFGVEYRISRYGRGIVH